MASIIVHYRYSQQQTNDIMYIAVVYILAWEIAASVQHRLYDFFL